MLKALIRRYVPRSLYPSAIIRRDAIRRTGCTVCAGPFQGMRYLDRSIWGAYVPKLIGTYERELHGCLERAIARRPRGVIDIGGAEGYYAVGLALRLPKAAVVAFEQLEIGRRAIEELAEKNFVADRVSIRGSCDPAALRDAFDGVEDRALVVCDVEGYEQELLDPLRVPELARADLLVEVHDSQVPGCRALLTERFCETHDVEWLSQERRERDEYPFPHAITRVPGIVTKYALNEFRSPGTSWLWMQARSTPAEPA